MLHSAHSRFKKNSIKSNLWNDAPKGWLVIYLFIYTGKTWKTEPHPPTIIRYSPLCSTLPPAGVWGNVRYWCQENQLWIHRGHPTDACVRGHARYDIATNVPVWLVQNWTQVWRVFVCVFAGRVFNGSGKPIDRGPAVLAEDFLDIMGQFLPLQLLFVLA